MNKNVQNYLAKIQFFWSVTPIRQKTQNNLHKSKKNATFAGNNNQISWLIILTQRMI